jgi:hypothetical protein
MSAKDCQGTNRVTGDNCHTKATKHIVEPGSLRMRHFCAPHAVRYLQQVETTAEWTAKRNAEEPCQGCGANIATDKCCETRAPRLIPQWLD